MSLLAALLVPVHLWSSLPPADTARTPPFVARRLADGVYAVLGRHRPGLGGPAERGLHRHVARAWSWWMRWRAPGRARRCSRTIRRDDPAAGALAGAHPPSSRPPLRRHRVPAGGCQGHRPSGQARARQRRRRGCAGRRLGTGGRPRRDARVRVRRHPRPAGHRHRHAAPGRTDDRRSPTRAPGTPPAI